MTEEKAYRLLFVGDVVMDAQRGVPDSVRTLVASFEADCAVANSEIPLTKRGTRAAKFVAWRASPAVAKEIKALGFDGVTLANNHALDYGCQGLEDTLAGFHAAGVKTVGMGKNLDDALFPAVFTFGASNQVAILSVACTLPLGFDAGADRPGVAPVRVSTRYEFDPMDIQDEPGCLPTFIHTEADRDDVERLCREIRRLKTGGHLVVVCIHWGNAFQKRLAKYQQPLARALEKAGCDLVLGHHPHTIHGIEVIGEMPVLYSVGNFIMDKKTVAHGESDLPSGLATQWTMSPEGLAAVVDIVDEKVDSLRVVPVLLDDGFPARASGAAGEKILQDIETYPPGPVDWQRERDTAVIRLR